MEEIKVLDDGFVRLVDVMGDDSSIVQAARVSYGEGTKSVSSDRGLIRYLMRHGHTSPIEQVEMKFHIRIPMDAWRQAIRHRTFNTNEYSTRYSIAIDATQKTEPDQWRLQAKNNKQGSAGFLNSEMGEYLSKQEGNFIATARDMYEQRLKLGVAREQARKDLPLSTYTEAYWKNDLHNIFHFLRLRLDSHAQLEIRKYAEAIAVFVKNKFPLAWEAFEDYRLHSMHLTGLDLAVIEAIEDGEKVAEKFGWLKRREDGTLKGHRERQECEGKLRRLGLYIPWR